MDPSKDLAAYGYGSVAWKERVDSWKLRQEKMMTEGSHHHKGGDMDGGGDGPDLPMYGSSSTTKTPVCFSLFGRLNVSSCAEWMNRGSRCHEKCRFRQRASTRTGC